jgi:hypothetical protein
VNDEGDAEMSELDRLPEKDWGKAESPVIKPLLMARGTFETIDLAKTRLLLEEVLGFLCVEIGPGRAIFKQRNDRPGSTYWVLEAQEVPEVRSPQHMTNHWGIWVPTRQAVSDAAAVLQANKERYGLLRVQSPRMTHDGARDFSFYFEDISNVWWEIGENPDEDELMKLFANGVDWDRREGQGT